MKSNTFKCVLSTANSAIPVSSDISFRRFMLRYSFSCKTSSSQAHEVRSPLATCLIQPLSSVAVREGALDKCLLSRVRVNLSANLNKIRFFAWRASFIKSVKMSPLKIMTHNHHTNSQLTESMLPPGRDIGKRAAALQGKKLNVVFCRNAWVC